MPRSVHTDDYRRLIALLVEARKAINVTQAELAATLGKPQSYISKVENGERRLDVVEFCRWAQGLEREPGSLLSEFLSLDG